ncbi:YIP1 family protein [Phaeovulum vinaykumarii]|uniref:YIP1 family protein n=1 Tax=Phaeovulum vinaykumarii TaxID=407234 RepID=A0A1N7JIR5_9RHOB|nr:YIP1 family protein [Phaeovulum vinaykumarii]SIS49154.1 hypothetical protein SAMN05421795_10114 [Phaeovulum vinaykumarii]SOB89431.1 hypothetical protein SAMN05878426_10114 [Phaeovulum vinaykumarii]
MAEVENAPRGRQMRGIVPKIVASWRRPRVVMRAVLAEGQREDRAIATLIAACTILFVGQWPMHARAAHLDPSVPLDARLTGALMASLFILPLLAYVVAGVSRLVVRILGGRGPGWACRMALFWSLLAISPFMLLRGLVAGMIGPGGVLTGVDVALGLGFVALWIACLRVAGFEEKAWS